MIQDMERGEGRFGKKVQLCEPTNTRCPPQSYAGSIQPLYPPLSLLHYLKNSGPTKKEQQKGKKKKGHNYGATCILIGLGVEIDATVVEEGVLVAVLGCVVFVVVVGGVVVVKSERGHDDDDDNDNDEDDDDDDGKVKVLLLLSNGGVEEVDEEDDIGRVNVKG